MIYYIIGAITFLFLILIILTIYSQIINIKYDNLMFNEINDDIKSLQKKQISHLHKVAKAVEEIKNVKILENLNDLKNDEIQSQELDKKLQNQIKELKDFLFENKIELNKENKQLINILKNNVTEIKALKELYNIKLEKYNKKFQKFWYIIPKLITKSKKKEKYIIEKEIDFEILKPQN